MAHGGSEERRVGASAAPAPPQMTAQLLADAQRVLRSCAGGSAAQLAQRSLAQQVAHRLLELKARPRRTSEASRLHGR